LSYPYVLDAAGRLAEADQAIRLSLENRQPLLAHETRPGPYVDVHPVLDDLGLGDPLEVQPRTDPGRIEARAGPVIVLELVAEYLGPEPGDPQRIRAVEGDLDLPDR